jgi:hypothetical protein
MLPDNFYRYLLKYKEDNQPQSMMIYSTAPPHLVRGLCNRVLHMFDEDVDIHLKYPLLEDMIRDEGFEVLQETKAVHEVYL